MIVIVYVCMFSTIGQFTRLCIVYVVLTTLHCLWTLNSMLYSIFRIPKYLFFLAFKQFYSMKPILLLKNIKKIYTFFSFSQFDSMTPIQLLKTYENNVYIGVSFSTKTCTFYFKKMQFFVCFLKMFRPLKRVVCFILNNLHFPMAEGIAFYALYKSRVLIIHCKADDFCLFIELLDVI